MGHAEVISLDEVRATQRLSQLRQQLHDFFDQWLDRLEPHLDDEPMSLTDLTAVMGQLRQDLMGGLTETVIEHTYTAEIEQTQAECPTCDRLLTVRRQAHRTVDTLIGPVRLKRSYFYCLGCRQGFHPLDASLEVVAGRYQLDVQQAIAQGATEMPYETAHSLLRDWSGIEVSVERMHTLTNAMADGLSVLDVSPDVDDIRSQIRTLESGKRRRPVMVLAIDGAHVPTRPDEAGELIDAPKRHRARRARWKGGYKEAKGLRLYAFDAERIVHMLSWHQVQEDDAIGAALDHIKDKGLIPDDEGMSEDWPCAYVSLVMARPGYGTRFKRVFPRRVKFSITITARNGFIESPPPSMEKVSRARNGPKRHSHGFITGKWDQSLVV